MPIIRDIHVRSLLFWRFKSFGIGFNRPSLLKLFAALFLIVLLPNLFILTAYANCGRLESITSPSLIFMSAYSVTGMIATLIAIRLFFVPFLRESIFSHVSLTTKILTSLGAVAFLHALFAGIVLIHDAASSGLCGFERSSLSAVTIASTAGAVSVLVPYFLLVCFRAIPIETSRVTEKYGGMFDYTLHRTSNFFSTEESRYPKSPGQAWSRKPLLFIRSFRSFFKAQLRSTFFNGVNLFVAFFFTLFFGIAAIGFHNQNEPEFALAALCALAVIYAEIFSIPYFLLDDRIRYSGSSFSDYFSLYVAGYAQIPIAFGALYLMVSPLTPASFFMPVFSAVLIMTRFAIRIVDYNQPWRALRRYVLIIVGLMIAFQLFGVISLLLVPAIPAYYVIAARNKVVNLPT